MRLNMRLGAMTALALAAILGTAPVLFASEPVAGVIIDVKGKPQIKHKGKKKWKRVKLSNFVKQGDSIKTGPGELVAVAFVAGTEVRINENSEFIMESGGGAEEASIFSKLGQAFTRRLHQGAGLNISSPLAVAAVRGTEADVSIGDRMSVKVYEGHVDLMNPHGKTSLRAGSMAAVTGMGVAPGAARQMTPSDIGAWQKDLSPKKLKKNLLRLRKAADAKRKVCVTYRKDGVPDSFCIELKRK